MNNEQEWGKLKGLTCYEFHSPDSFKWVFEEFEKYVQHRERTLLSELKEKVERMKENYRKIDEELTKEGKYSVAAAALQCIDTLDEVLSLLQKRADHTGVDGSGVN